MLKLDDIFLQEVGLWPLRRDVAELAKSVAYYILEARVGEALAERLSAQQIAEFQTLLQDEPAAREWLDEAIPDYRSTVRLKYLDLKAEIKEDVWWILEAVGEIVGREGLEGGSSSEKSPDDAV